MQITHIMYELAKYNAVKTKRLYAERFSNCLSNKIFQKIYKHFKDMFIHLRTIF